MGGGFNVSKVPTIDRIDKFILKKNEKNKNRERGRQKDIERSQALVPRDLSLDDRLPTTVLVNQPSLGKRKSDRAQMG